MEQLEYIWMNGEMVKWDNATTHILSHSLHYGGGVFEGIRCYETKDNKVAIFRLHEHVERLFYSASSIGMNIPFSKKDIFEAILKLVKENNLKSGYIRPFSFYGYGQMGLTPSGAQLNVCIACWPWGSYLGDSPIKVKISKYIRIHPKSTNIQAKISGHYINSILASQEAKDAGFDEALLLDYEGNVAEGPGENIFIVKDNIIKTPDSRNILKGITRDSIIQIAEFNGYKLLETKISPDDLKDADEAFLTGTAAEVTPIGQIDDTIVGDGKVGPVTALLKSSFVNIINGNDLTYNKWLTYV